MKKALVILSVAALGAMAAPTTAYSQVHACDASDTLCIRHCLAYHRGLDRVVCLVDHNIANVS